MKRLLAALLLVALGACHGDAADQDFQGYVEGEYLRIAAADAGWLANVAVAKGQQVTAGTLLFTLDPTREAASVAEARARLAQAESDLADLRLGSRPEEIAAIEAQLADAEAAVTLANLTLDRQSRLITTHAVSQSQLDSARAGALQAAAQVARIRAELAVARLPARRDRVVAAEDAVEAARHVMEQAQWHLDQRRVSSPVAALVDDVVRRPGEWVPANGTVVSLLPQAGIKVVFFVPEPRRAAIRPDATVAVACTGCPSGLTARVSRIASEAEYTPPVIFSRETRAKLVFRIEAVLANVPGAPLPGQPVTVQAEK
jgi:HlyD family secretion protein